MLSLVNRHTKLFLVVNTLEGLLNMTGSFQNLKSFLLMKLNHFNRKIYQR